MSRNVLIIAYYFPPMGLSGVQRTTKFVKYLPEFGWNPVILTTNPGSFYAFDDSLTQNFEGNEIKIYRTDSDVKHYSKPRKNKKFPSYFRQKIGRMILQTLYQPDSRISWKKSAVKLGSQIIEENNIDVIFATAPPYTDFLVAQELSKKHNIPFIVDYRDVWIDNPFHFYPTPFHKNKAIKFETEILTHAEKAIVTTRHTKELLLRRYGFINHEDVKIISHGYDPDDFNKYINYQKKNDKFVITHSGLFQDDRNPKYFLKALSNFIKSNKSAESTIEARFVGLMRSSHLKYIKKYKLQNVVKCTGYLNHEESVMNLMDSDVLWFMLNDTVRSPGKLFEYFGARKPILACAPQGIIRKTALDSKAAIAVDPANIKEIENAISTFYQLWQNGTLPVPNDEFVQQFNRRKLTEDLAKELALALEL